MKKLFMLKKSSKFSEKNACTFFDKMDCEILIFKKIICFVKREWMLLVYNLFYSI